MSNKGLELLKQALKAFDDEGTKPEDEKAEDVEGKPEAEKPEAEDGAAAEEAKIDEAAKSAADKIVAALQLDKVDKLFAAIEKLGGNDGDISKMVSQGDLRKQRNEMTKDELIVAFTKALITNNKAVIKALSEGTAADGGNLFPNEFRAEIIRRLEDTPRMRSLVTVIPMRKDVMDIPTEAAKSTVFWGSENAAITTTTADFGTKQLTAYRLNSIMYLSRELVDDASEIGVVSLIIQQFADAVGQEEDKVIIQGSGSGQPTGLNGASGHHTVQCVSNLSFDHMINTFYALPQRYRGEAVWLVATANVRELRQLKDSQNRYLWIDSPTAGQPPTILGRPVYENTWVPEDSIFFGDLKRAYYLGDRQQMTVETSTEAGSSTWEKHQVGIKVIERIAGVTVLEDALAELQAIP